MTRAWDKGKIWVPKGIYNPWAPKYRAGALSTDLQELIENEGI